MLNRKNGRGSSMISTGIVGTPFQSYSPKSASWILVNTSAFAGPPISRISAPRRDHRGIAQRDAGHLHREVRLDRRREVRGPGLEEAVAAVGELLVLEVADRARLLVAVDLVDEMAQEQLLGGDRRVGFELTDPVTVGSLSAQQVRLGALDCVLQVPHGVMVTC